MIANDTEVPGICECGCGGQLPHVFRKGYGKQAHMRMRFIPNHSRRRILSREQMFRLLMSRTTPEESGCMVFTGFRKRSENGRHITYGTIRWNGKLWAAHRLSYFLINGDIPAGMLVCHACDNAGCVNPEHLWLGTEADNNRDRDQKGRHVTQTSEHNARATTTFEVAERLRRDHTASPKYKGLIVELAAKYGLNRNVASLIVQGRTYRKPPAASRSK